MTEQRAQGKVGIFNRPIAGALAYMSFIPAIVFLAVAPYKTDQFVRFHSIQCILLLVSEILLAIALKLASLLLFIIPVAGPLFVLVVTTVAVIGAVVLWLVLVVKAVQGEMFRLPLLGDFAADHAARP